MIAAGGSIALGLRNASVWAAAVEHDALTPAGPQATQIHDLWTLMWVVCTLVLVAILAVLGVALWRAPRGSRSFTPAAVPLPSRERSVARVVATAVVVSTVLLFALVVASVATDRKLLRLGLDDAVHIDMTSHMWWWELTYTDGSPSDVFVTANEMHIPIGRPVIVTLRSDDVIHSFWVPNLHGKKDLIPGRVALIQFRADRAGIYRGQCAEFCGFQHANMSFDVIAESPEEYAQWLAQQRQPAASPTDALAKRGEEVFESSTCAMCHAISGSRAQARTAPDLTHFASRRTIGAGTLPNTPGHLAGWVLNAQALKPGVIMPPQPLPSNDQHALLAYLGSLK